MDVLQMLTMVEYFWAVMVVIGFVLELIGTLLSPFISPKILNNFPIYF